VAIVLAMVGYRRADRKEREAIRETALAEQDRKHEENQKLLYELLHEDRERPNHRHDEHAGPLTAEGIKYRPRTGSDG